MLPEAWLAVNTQGNSPSGSTSLIAINIWALNMKAESVVKHKIMPGFFGTRFTKLILGITWDVIKACQGTGLSPQYCERLICVMVCLSVQTEETIERFRV